ncbi:MAG: tRNA threonylcarbamoyladenosine dehydratase [Clostridia bacterium]|nr:tRNA threonylcarbamoyladenosine dehydratase [Clostridia bacterium]
MDSDLLDTHWQARTELLIGCEGVRRLARASVIVVGLGGVGSHCAEALARAGIGSLTLVDGDVITPSNINRQSIALPRTVGMAKADAMAIRVREINPDCNASSVIQVISAENAAGLLSIGPDYVADAIDSIDAKLGLIEACMRASIPIVSSMGAGNKLDPTRFRVADISQTHTCPMAKAVRLELRSRGIARGLSVVFSDEPPVARHPGTLGSISTVPPAAGLAMAGLILRELSGICVPHTN